jgi:transposase
LERWGYKRRAQSQQHRDPSCQVSFSAIKALKEIRAIFTETGEYAPSYATVKHWVTQFQCGGFSTCEALRPGRTKSVNTQLTFDKIHELILENRRLDFG